MFPKLDAYTRIGSVNLAIAVAGRCCDAGPPPFYEKNGSARLCVARAALESHLKFMHHRYCWVVVKVAWHAADGVVGVIHTGHRIMPCGIIDSRHCQSLYFAPRSSTTVTAPAKSGDHSDADLQP